MASEINKLMTRVSNVFFREIEISRNNATSIGGGKNINFNLTKKHTRNNNF